MTTPAPDATALLTPVVMASATAIRERLSAPQWPDPHSGDFFRDYLADQFGDQGRLAALIVVTGMIGRTEEYLAKLPPVVGLTFAMLQPEMIAALAFDREVGGKVLRDALALATSL